jgi:uncharacterized protein involved in exopolysaccharide biosynthesis
MDGLGVNEHRQPRKSESTPQVTDPRPAGPTDVTSLAGLRENVSEAVRILGLRRWHFLVPFCIGTVLATSAAHYLPRTYSASTTFERVDDDVLQNLPVRSPTGTFLPFRETLARDVKSPEVLDEAVTTLGLDEGLPKNPDGTLTPSGQNQLRRIGNRLAGAVTAGLVSQTEHKDTVRLVYSGPEVNLAGPLLDALRDAYIRNTRVRITQKLQENLTYFEGEAATRRARVDALEQEKVLREINSPTVDPTNPDVIFLKLTALKNDERELKRQQDTLRSKLLKTRQYADSILAAATAAPNLGLTLPFAPVHKSARWRAIEEEINRIDGEIDDLRIKRQMTDQHPEIIERRELRQRYAQLLASDPDPSLVVSNQGLTVGEDTSAVSNAGDVWRAEKLRAEMDAVGLEDELERVAGSLRQVSEEIATLEQARENVPEARRAYRELQDELTQAYNEYTVYAQTAKQFGLLLTADEGERGIKFVGLGPAVADTKPNNPKSKSILVLALLIGTGAGVMFVLLAELFDRSYHTSKQVVQSLGLGILETIDEIVTSVDRARRFRRRFILAPAATVLLVGAVGVSTLMAYLTLEQPSTYERLMQRPRAVWTKVSERLAGGPAASEDALAGPAEGFASARTVR